MIFFNQCIMNWRKVQRFFFFFLLIHGAPTILAAGAHWHVLILMQADEVLKVPVQAALEAMKKSIADTPDHRISLFVQVIEGNFYRRYSNENNGTRFEMVMSNTHFSRQYADMLKDAVAWALPKNDRGQTALLFSGHGSGILEPQWSVIQNRWCYDADEGDCYYRDYRSNQNQQFFDTYMTLCEGHKSLFLNTGTKASCGEIISIVESAARLWGKKIDIVGFDACHMAMLEIAYPLEPYARTFIASQDCEEKEGWDYKAVLGCLHESAYSIGAARSIVYAHEKSQRHRGCSLYSLSAIDMSSIENVLNGIEKVAAQMSLCLKMHGGEFHDVLCCVREQNQRFCFFSQYADVRCFFEKLIVELSSLYTEPEYVKLYADIYDLLEVLQQCILAHIASERCSLAQGCSIYFPYARLDGCYSANASNFKSWISFLEQFIATAS